MRNALQRRRADDLKAAIFELTIIVAVRFWLHSTIVVADRLQDGQEK